MKNKKELKIKYKNKDEVTADKDGIIQEGIIGKKVAIFLCKLSNPEMYELVSLGGGSNEKMNIF